MLLVVLLVIMAVAAGLLAGMSGKLEKGFRGPITKNEPVSIPTPAPVYRMEIKAGWQAEKELGRGRIVLSILPKAEMTLSAFDLRVILKAKSAGSLAAGGAIVMEKSWAEQGWSFPIKRTIMEKDDLVIELSGIRLEPAAFELSKETILLEVPVKISKEVEGIEAVVDGKVTKFLTREVKPIEITGPKEEIRISN